MDPYTQHARYSIGVLKASDSNRKFFRTGKICQQTAVTVNSHPPINIQNKILPPFDYTIGIAQKWLTLYGRNGKVYQFPVQTILPKVHMNRIVPPKTLPRDVEVDRRRREYARMNLKQMLADAHLGLEELMPTEELYFSRTEYNFKHFLPLSFFDDSSFDCHSPEAWMQLCLVDGKSYALPAKAFLPVNESETDFGWQNSAVSEYDEKKGLWTVMSLVDERVYKIPKVQFMFFAENANIFVKRLQQVEAERNNAETLLQMEAVVDCMMWQELGHKKFTTNPRIENLLQKLGATNPLFQKELRLEVYLVFEHLMALYEFARFVKLMPKEFPDFGGNLIKNSLPKAFPPQISDSERKNIKSLELNMKGTRYSVLRTTLFYTAGGIEAMMNVVAECQYVETLSMFVCSFAKPLPLSDFLQSQQQNSNNVASYLKNVWPSKVSAGICIVLRPLGKGWLDISLSKWSVYQMCKIIRFILQVKLRMQETMQVMLEKSIENFTTFLTAPCLQFLDIEADYKWPNNYIETDFPYVKPVFSLVIGISDDQKVFYSTPPEEFEPSLTEVFKKALEKTSGVRCIDAETMTNLRFAPNLYILTVELIEEFYLRCNDLLNRCYTKAVYPLRAYAKLYERFIPFYLLNVTDYLRKYEEAQKSSAQVKADILEHKRQKQELRDILPATITIGPFLIIVDPLKQFMIKKLIEIIKRLFEYYVQRMWDINDALLERCLFVYNKLSERPQSIEHLYEIRDFGVMVPNMVEQLKADIQIMWLEYELLDGFFYNLSDAQFSRKWEVYAWPHNIMQRLSTLREEQKIDIEEFRRIHLSECGGFEERLESLNEEIQAFSLQFDVNKVTETAVDVKKTWKIIMDLQKLGQILKYRQSLFELEELSLEFLDSIISGFTPYRLLWNSCSDFLKLQEATEGNPIVNIELADVWQTLEDLTKTLKECYEIFNEKPEIQEVATTFLQRISEFIPVYECIKALKNENWLYLHWQELSNRSGIEIKYSLAMNFLYLIKKGMMEHLDLVHEISERANHEAEAIRKAWEEEERRKEEELMAILRRKAMRKCRTDII